MADPELGRNEYLKAHIPGAVYANLDEDLCGPVIPGVTGRHPLPAVLDFLRTLSGWGIGDGVQVIAYDDAGGSMAAARLWWMLQWLGHSGAAVLNGGWQRWQSENLPVRPGVEKRSARRFQARIQPERVVDSTGLEAALKDKELRIIDVRAGERYRGEVEPLDPVAGHIPGAISVPYTDTLEPGGSFKSPEVLRAGFSSLLREIPAERAIFYCGSGVTAAQSVLALAHSGLGQAKLYAGSWSEWITDPGRPIATG